METSFISFVYYNLIAIASSFALSGEIMDAFKTVNEGLVIRSEVEATENKMLRDSVAVYVNNDTLKARLAEVAVMQETYKTYLKGLKYALINRGGGLNDETGDFNDAGNIKVASFLFVEHKQGEELYYRMKSLTKAMQALAITDAGKKSISIIDNCIRGEEAADWAKHWFDKVPLMAAVTIVTKFENDERIAEAALLRDLLYNAK